MLRILEMVIAKNNIFCYYWLGRVDNCSPRLHASACPRHVGDAQVKNKAKLKARSGVVPAPVSVPLPDQFDLCAILVSILTIRISKALPA